MSLGKLSIPSIPITKYIFGSPPPPPAGPTKSFNFQTQTIDPLIVFSRGSTGTYWDMNGVMQTAASGAPRFDFDPAAFTLRGLLIEESRTNIARRSNEITTTYYEDASNGTATNRNQIDVFGNANSATRINELATSATHLITIKVADNVNFVSGTTYTQSVFVKAVGTTRCQLTMAAAGFTGTTPYANFRLTGAGAVLSQGGTVTPAIQFMGNGWYRISITTVANANAAGSPVILAFINSDTALRLPSYAGNTGNTLDICCFQMEVGEFASSVIVTAGASVTRAQDQVSISGTNFSGFYNQAAGTWVSEFIFGPRQNLANRVIDVSDSSAANSIFIFRSNTSDEIDASINLGGVNSYSSNQVGWTPYSPQRHALAYSNGNSKAALNRGLDGASSSAGAMPAVNRIDIGNRYDLARTMNGWFRSLDYYDTRLTNTQLQDLSEARPVPGAMSGLTPQVGVINAVNGQTISGLQLSTAAGNCIVIGAGVHDVTIEFCDIGPAGSDYNDTNAKAIDIQAGAYNITVRSCVLHDCASGIYADAALHPIDFKHNYVYNVRGPLPRGQMIQLNGVAGGTRSSKILYNLSDALAGFRYGVDHGLGVSASGGVEDHINMYGSPGISSVDPVEIAYNHARGGHAVSTSGSMMILGDGSTQSGNQYAHHNVAVYVKNVGIGIAGGINQRIEYNKLLLDNTVIYANIASYVINYAAPITCNLISFLNNRSWCFNGTIQNNFYWQNGGANDCTNVTRSDTSPDATLNRGMFGIDIP